MRPGGRARRHERRVGLALVALVGVVYLFVAGGGRGDYTSGAMGQHFWMADALLHGRLALRPDVLPDRAAVERQRTADEQGYFDLIILEGRVYGYWGIVTPALLVPVVAVWGLEVPPRLITVGVGVMNAGLLYVWLLRLHGIGWLRMRRALRVALTLLLALGSMQFWMVCDGGAWFVVQLGALGWLLAALVVLTRRRPGWFRIVMAGGLFGLAILTRNSVALVGLFPLVLVWRGAERRKLAALALFCGPLLAAVVGQLAYNAGRFGDPFEFGMALQIEKGGARRYADLFAEHGLLSWRYVPRNVYHYFLSADFPQDTEQGFDDDGNSVFLVMPPMVLALMGVWRGGWLKWAALAGLVPFVGFLQLLVFTGWVQFGPRFLLEALPLAFVLVALGVGRRLREWHVGLFGLAVAVQAYGVSRICARLFTEAGGAGIREWTFGYSWPIALAAIVLGMLAYHWLQQFGRRGGRVAASGGSANNGGRGPMS
jgi:hypothetical protein